MSRNPLIVCVLLVMFTVLADAATNEDLEDAFWNFAVKFQQTAVKMANPEENVLFSPLGIYITLALLHLGATSQTRKELNFLMELPDTDQSTLEMFHQRLSSMINHAQNLGDSTSTININPAAFVQTHLGTKEAFLRDIKKYYDATAINVDFHDNATTYKAVRRWAANKTNGEISNLYLPLPPSIDLLFITTSQFEAEWARPFFNSQGQMEPFHTNSPEPIQVRMMLNVMSVMYGQNEKLKIQYIGIPYLDDRYFMYIILPNDSERLDNVIYRLDANDLREIFKTRESDNMAVKIPIMKFGWAEFVDDHLERLGLKSLADTPLLAGMLTRIPSDRIKVYQVAHLEFNYRGTSVKSEFLDVPKNESFHYTGKKFYVNKPFLLYIYQKDTSSILFTVAVYNPATWHTIF